MFTSIFEFVSEQVDDWNVADVLKVFTLKQFPNELDPTKACYQSLVMIDHDVRYADKDSTRPNFMKWLSVFWKTEPEWDLSLPLNRNDRRLDEAKIDVHQDICNSLGLVSEDLDDCDLKRCQPTFYARVQTQKPGSELVFHEALGKNLCYRYSVLDDDSTPGSSHGWRK